MTECTRAEWEAKKRDSDAQLGTWGFDPDMPWHVATLGERVKIVAFKFFLYCIVGPVVVVGGLFGFMWFVATAGDNIAADKSRVSSCQKHADTPREYHQCR